MKLWPIAVSCLHLNKNNGGANSNDEILKWVANGFEKKSFSSLEPGIEIQLYMKQHCDVIQFCDLSEDYILNQ
jgi:hypothetical protein